MKNQIRTTLITVTAIACLAAPVFAQEGATTSDQSTTTTQGPQHGHGGWRHHHHHGGGLEKICIGQNLTLPAGTALDSSVFDSAAYTDAQTKCTQYLPPKGAKAKNNSQQQHHHGLFGICLGQNLPAGTALPTFTPGQKEANMAAFKAFFSSSAFQTAAGKCTQFKPKGHHKKGGNAPSQTPSSDTNG